MIQIRREDEQRAVFHPHHDLIGVSGSELRDRWERITAPTLAISAKDDLYNTAGGAKYAAEQIPGARLILLPTGGHAWLGHDAVVRDEVVNFLRRATSSR